MHQLTPNFMQIFRGRDSAHGTYDLSKEQVRPDGKRKGKAITKTEPVTLELWNEHLIGKAAIGIVPINEANKCVWGCIDVDQYKMGHSTVSEFIQRIRVLKLPLVPFRSKSGGLHLFLFTKGEVGAGILRRKLQEFAAALGVGSAEIFPKQAEITEEGGGIRNVGSWLNMPYFGVFSGEGKVDRYAYNDVGEPMSPEEFIRAHSIYAQYPEELSKVEPEFKEAFSDGPPCLSRIAGTPAGFLSGRRNILMFNLITYLKKKHGENFADAAHKANKLYCRRMDAEGNYHPEPMSDAEMAILLRPRKAYHFQCDESPLKDHCDRAICRFRQYGVGLEGTGLPKLGTLEKHELSPPIWVMNLEGTDKRAKVSTDQLYSYRNYQKVVLEQLNIIPPPLKEQDWQKYLQRMLETVSIINYPEDSTGLGAFKGLLREFLTGRVQAKALEEIMAGKPYADEEFHYFRLIDLKRFLDRHRFADIKQSEIPKILRDECGAGSIVERVRGGVLNIWKIMKEEIDDSSFKTPDGAEPEEVL